MTKQTNVRLSDKATGQIKTLRERYDFLKSDATAIEYALNFIIGNIEATERSKEIAANLINKAANTGLASTQLHPQTAQMLEDLRLQREETERETGLKVDTNADWGA